MERAHRRTLSVHGRWAVAGAALAIAAAACGGGNGSASLTGQGTGRGQYSSGGAQGAPGAAEAAPAAPGAPAPAAPGAAQAAPVAPGGAAGYAAPGSSVQGAAPAAQPGAAKNQLPNPVGGQGAAGAAGSKASAPGASDVGVTAATITLGRIDFESATRSLGSIIAEPSTVVEQGIVDWMNQQGGINGRKLVLLKCDDGGDMTRAVACYQKMKSQVFMFMPSETWLTEIAHQYVDRDKVPMMTWGWFLSEFTDPYMFPCHANGEHEAVAETNWVLAHKQIKTAGIVYLNVTEDINAANASAKILEDHGVKVVQKIPQEWDSPDESQHVLALRVANPDIVFGFSWPGPNAKLLHDADEQHWAPANGYYLNHLTLDPGYGPVYGSYIKGKVTAITSFVYPPDAAPGNSFWEMITKNFGGYNLEGLRWKYAAGHHVTQGSVACMRIAFNVLKELGPNPTRAAFIDYLESHQFDSGMGIVMRWPKGNHNMDPYAYNREYLYQWVDSTVAGPGGNGGYDEQRILPDPVYRPEIEPCKSPKVEECRPMQEPGSILHGAGLYYHDQPYYN
ncbi:MAG: Extracellular ligand-binding receptor [Chloroflexi bacterium]|jgi:ABC-type branched-subunit amino acid transport system substrate-binding protein|nr:Extracellular ligand-binding receptor [Chloroflexota bacterium]